MFPIGHTGSARRALSEILFLLVPNTAKRLEKKKTCMQPLQNLAVEW